MVAERTFENYTDYDKRGLGQYGNRRAYEQDYEQRGVYDKKNSSKNITNHEKKIKHEMITKKRRFDKNEYGLTNVHENNCIVEVKYSRTAR